ncbi:MAG: hypothetical protein MZV64_43905 [Ignavibacteriales bacterium]|nr:hypothetical protein [Ignavibacteriales bacterium]
MASHAYERLFLHGDTIYIANLSQLKLVWNFSVRSFVRAILQYSDQEQNPAAYAFPVDSRNRGPVHPVPVLLQAQSADGPLPGLFGQLAGRRLRQLARAGPRRPHPDRPDLLPEDRLRLADLSRLAGAAVRPGVARLP